MLNDLQVPIEQEKKTEEGRLEDEMPRNIGVDIDEDTTNKNFVTWACEARYKVNHDSFSLMMEPSIDVRCYNRCIVGGLRFHTSELNSRCTTQNSGLMIFGVRDASGSGDNNFYGVVDEVLHVQYPFEKKLDDVENEHLNLLEIVVSHRVDEHIEDDTLCRIDIEPTIIDRSVVRHVTNDFIDNTSFPHSFNETDAMFLEFVEDLDNLAEGSSSMDKNSGTSQPSATSTPRRQNTSRSSRVTSRYFKKYSHPEEARANLPHFWWDVIRINTTSVTTT
ncbi:gamma-aminobutyrate transaminase POP2 [Cucumis melo var. makuwa]|nr:gamma-aminobutyrate transaminase POP2 [Cucumis melo var. makuwa]